MEVNNIKVKILEAGCILPIKQFCSMKAYKYYMAHAFFETLCIAGLFGLEWILILIGAALLLISSI